MKKRLIAIVCVATLVCSIGVTQAFAMGPRGGMPGGMPEGMERPAFGERPEGMPERPARGERPEGMPEKPDGMQGERFGGRHGGKFGGMTDEQKAQMEAARAEREEKVNAFLASLSDEQKALYNDMMPQFTKPTEGQSPAKPDESAMQAMKEKQEAFVASLTEAQKAAYDELFARPGFPPEKSERPFGKQKSQ